MATSRKSGVRAKAKAKAAKAKAKAKAAKPRVRPVAKTAARKPPASSKKRLPSKPSSRPTAKSGMRPAAKAAVKVVAKSSAGPAVKPFAAKPVAAKVAAAKVVAAKVMPVKAVAGKPGAKPLAKAVGKDGKTAAPGAKKGASAATGSGSKKSRRPAVPEVVRPLGVLPPESIARTRERSPSRATPPRPAPAAPARPQTAPQGVQPLTEQDRKYFEERLLAERAKLMREMGHLENTVLKVSPRDSSGDLSGYSFHMADAGTDAYEREKAFLFASSEGRTLLEINEALRRLYGGTFGICETSGKPISRARLEAIPWARYTLEVQEQLEKEERSRRSTP